MREKKLEIMCSISLRDDVYVATVYCLLISSRNCESYTYVYDKNAKEK